MTARLFHRLSAAMFGCICLGVMIAGIWDAAGITSRTRDASLDMLTRLFPFKGDAQLASKLVLVDIDEASLAELGQWPWPRTVLAALLDRIGSAEPLAVGIDILMTEEDRFNPGHIARLANANPGLIESLLPDGDILLGETISRMPVVMATALAAEEPPRRIHAPVKVTTLGPPAASLISASGLLSPIEALATSPGSGFVNLSLARDTSVRRMPMVARVNQEIIPSFSLEMLRLAQNGKSHVLKPVGTSSQVSASLKTGRIIIPLDAGGQFPLHHGFSTRFPRISAVTILHGADRASWAGQIEQSFVVIGSTAAGLKDFHATALEPVLPGPYLHLQALHQILSGRLLHSGEAIAMPEIVLAGLFSMMMAGLMLRLPFLWGTALAMVATAGITGTYFWAFLAHGLIGNIFFTLGLMMALSLISICLRAGFEEYRRRKLRLAFGQYLSPTMVQDIDAAGGAVSLGGKTAEISILFLDIRGFTRLSEKLADDPARLTSVVNIIMDRATAIVLEHGGTLDKYIGDALMAFWNAPVAQDDHAARAIRAAIALEKNLPAINAAIRRDIGPLPSLKVGIGIASGTVVVGNLGSSFRFSYSCMGDAVNLAARLEALSKETGLAISIAEATATDAGGEDLIEIDRITLRGMKRSTRVFSPLSLETKTRHLHEELQQQRACGNRRGAAHSLRQLKASRDYPASLVAYYRRMNTA